MDWWEVSSRMKQSLGDVWASIYQGRLTDEAIAEARRLEFAISVIETMEDMVEEENTYGTNQD